MRRWFLLLLLIVLPLQFASAATASYCQHETVGLAKHFGHHEHQHRTTGDSKASLSSTVDFQEKAGLGDPDCEYCHLGAAYPLPQDFGQADRVLQPVPTTETVLRFGSRDPDVLDRPNWACLA